MYFIYGLISFFCYKKLPCAVEAARQSFLLHGRKGEYVHRTLKFIMHLYLDQSLFHIINESY